MKSNNDQLESIINELDKFLIDGYKIHRDFFSSYKEESKKPDFNLKDYIAKNISEYNDWFDICVATLGKLPKSHYTFHFVKPKIPAGLHLIGFPDEISRQKINLEYELYALEEIILRLEEQRALAVRQQIAEKELEADVLYKITFSWHTREIKLNQMLLSRPNSDSKNLNFFEYVYTHPNEQIKVKDIEKDTSYELSNNIQDILRDLGFKGNIRKLFFPIATKTKVMFVNPISKQYAIKNDLPSIKLPK